MKIYKIFAFLLLFFSSNFSLQALKVIPQEGKKPGQFLQVKEKNEHNTRIFDFNFHDELIGSVRKPPLLIGSNYEVYDNSDQFLGEGVVKIYSIGTPFFHGIEIEILDEQGTPIGLIEGQAGSNSTAGLRIYDKEGNLLGNAYLNPKEGIFGIDNQEQTCIMRMKKNVITDLINNWDIIVFDPDAIDIRIVNIFTALIVDIHGEFEIK